MHRNLQPRLPRLTDPHPSLTVTTSRRRLFFSIHPSCFPLPLPHCLSVSRFSFLDVILSLTFILSFHTCRDSPLILSRLSTYTLSFPSPRTVASRPTDTFTTTTHLLLHPLNSLVSIHPTIDSTETVLHRPAQPLPLTSTTSTI